VLLPLLEQQPAELVIANRSHAKAQQLVDLLKDALKDSPAEIQTQCEVSARLLEQLDTAFDLIINATSSSLSANSSAAMLPVSEKLISSSTLAYDMMYGATPSRFLEFSKNHGAQCRDGLGMLVEQAAQAFLIWRGVRPETSKVLHQLRAAVGSA